MDPSMLLSHFSNRQNVSAFSSTAGGNGGGGGGFSDLDFEETLASLIPQSNYNPNAQHHAFGGAGSNGYLGSSNGAFDAFGFQHARANGGVGGDFGAGTLDKPFTTQAAGSLPHYLSQSATTSRPSPPIPAFAASSPRDTRSSGATDMFGNPLTPHHESPNDLYGSYTSLGDSLPSPPPASTTSSTSTTKRRPSPPDRSRSTGVGKAPTSTARSRSARRASTAGGTGAYQALGAASHHGASAIVIPSSTSVSAPAHQIAMSMPAYPTANGGASSWFASAQAIAYAHAQTPEEPMDANGWRPQSGPTFVPASAPALGGSKKGGSKGLDDVLEDPSQKQCVRFRSVLKTELTLVRACRAALLTEKRRKRRESHNAVERRRRDNINDRITELASLLPECLLDQVNNGNDDTPGSPGTPMSAMLSPAPSMIPLPLLGTSPATTSLSASAAAAAAKPNKGIILSKSVEYIRYLQQLLQLHTQRTTELERIVAELRHDRGSSGTSGSESEQSPGSARLNAVVGSHIGDPSFNDKFLNAAASGAFAGGWGGMRIMEDEGDDEMEG